MMTSSIQGEGKSMLSRQLAQALADGGSKTLLVECDLRRPTFQDVFDIQGETGLTTFLSGHAGESPTIHETDHSNLFVVGAGLKAPNPGALLGSRKMEAFLEQACSSYQFVILDAPPVLAVAEARLLASMVEGVVVVVRAGTVARQAVRRTQEILARAGANVLGTVFNGQQYGTDGDAAYGGYYVDQVT
jgi:capsular exopolysaccharide synthesis family protein